MGLINRSLGKKLGAVTFCALSLFVALSGLLGGNVALAQPGSGRVGAMSGFPGAPPPGAPNSPDKAPFDPNAPRPNAVPLAPVGQKTELTTIKPNTVGKLVDGIVAVVGDKIVLKSELEAQIQQARAANANLPLDAECQVLDQAITQKVLVNQAEVDSLVITEDEVEQQLDRRIKYFIGMVGSQEKLEEFYGKSVYEIKDEFRQTIKEQALAQKMQEKITAGLTVSPAEVETYFKELPVDSLPEIPAEFEVGVVIVEPMSSGEERTYAVEKIEGLRKRVVDGEKLSTLAILYSEDPGSASQGGDLGFFGRSEMVPEFEAWAFKLKSGEVSPVFKTKYGYHILQVAERRGERVQARHILVKVPVGKSDMAQAQAKLDSVRTQLVEGKISFTEAVRKYTTNEESRQAGGIVQAQQGSTRITAKQMEPQLYFLIDKLKVGEYSQVQPFAQADGTTAYRIAYLKTETTPHRANLVDDYSKIQEAALNEKRGRELEKWFDGAAGNAYLKISPEYANCEAISKWRPEVQ